MYVRAICAGNGAADLSFEFSFSLEYFAVVSVKQPPTSEWTYERPTELATNVVRTEKQQKHISTCKPDPALHSPSPSSLTSLQSSSPTHSYTCTRTFYIYLFTPLMFSYEMCFSLLSLILLPTISCFGFHRRCLRRSCFCPHALAQSGNVPHENKCLK